MTDRIEKTIELRAPIERVWSALTDSAQFSQWFRVKLDQPFVVGEVARGPISHHGYDHLTWEARIVAMDEPHLFSFTWLPYAVDPNVDYSGETPTLVEFRLTPTADGTRLVVVESGFDKVPAGRRDEAMRMNDGGWTQQVLNIKAHVGG
jgi:uncharacterized protein YndB with AHSA1/START domain